MGNTFGRAMRVTTWGESHGPATGAVVDGCPARLPLTAAMVQADLDRRRPGQSSLTSARAEPDRVQILSGVSGGVTLGTPLALWVANRDARPADYATHAELLRPSHADYTYLEKYGVRDAHGGGRASARETLARVAAGAVARQLLRARCGVEVVAWVAQVQDVVVPEAAVDVAAVDHAAVDATPTRCPHAASAAAMAACIAAARDAGDSLGGVVQAVARGVPAGWGEPVFDKLEADLARACLSIPACRGFEVGSGFAGAAMRGRAHNDAFYAEGGRIRTRTNRSGGIQGGISNGEAVLVRAAFKPTATIAQAQETVDAAGRAGTIAPRGRHDPCVLPRAVPVVEAMVALVLADHYLRQLTQQGG